jgi:hypothetical protein
MDEMSYLLTGAGLLHLDIALGLLAGAAAIIQYWRIAVWRSAGFVLAGRWMMAIGWTVMSGRILQTLVMVGDIFISLPSLIALILISAGSILVSVFWRSNLEGPV